MREDDDDVDKNVNSYEASKEHKKKKNTLHINIALQRDQITRAPVSKNVNVSYVSKNKFPRDTIRRRI